MNKREFELQVGSERVPGLLWTPADDGASGRRPTVLIGHGRGGHKSSEYVLQMAGPLVRDHGMAVAALDAPGHGDRLQPGADPTQPPPKPDPGQVAREWLACVDYLDREQVTDIGALGYFGLSMGTGMGMAFLAAEPRVRCAVLGLMHTHYYEGIVADAGRVRCPVLFLLQWDDSRVPRMEGLDLFDAIGSADKRLHAQPGDHVDVPAEEIEAAHLFLARYLG